MKKTAFKVILFTFLLGTLVSMPALVAAEDFDYFTSDSSSGFSDDGYDYYTGSSNDSDYDYFSSDYSDNDYDYYTGSSNDSDYDYYTGSSNDSDYDYFSSDYNDNDYDYFTSSSVDDDYDYFTSGNSEEDYDYYTSNSGDDFDYYTSNDQYDYYAPDEYDYYAPDEYDYYAPNRGGGYNGGSSYYGGGSGSFYGSIGTYGGYGYGGGSSYYNGGGYFHSGCGSNCGGGGGGGNPDRDLVIHCAANNDEIEVGESVTWIAQATGGNGNYTYTWTGSDGLLGQQRTVTKSYEEKGIKSATLTVKSGVRQKTVACTDVFVREERIIDPRPNLSVSCTASDTNVETDERVTWTAHVSGGNGNYTYDWSGSEGLSGNGRTVSISYNNDGEKTAGVRVSSGNQSQNVNCSDEVRVEDEDDNDNDDEDDRDIRVSCSADVISTSNGTRVRWEANVSRENGDVEYDWSGTDGLSGDDESITKTYYTSGLKYARVDVEDDENDEDEAECSVFVNAVLGYTNTYIPPYIPPATVSGGIYLSQVPYTGISDISLSLALFLASLALASAVGAYKIVKAKAKRDGVRAEVGEAELEIIARGAGLIFSRDALKYVVAIARREKRDAKEVVAFVRSKIAKVEDSMNAVSLEKVKKLIV